MGQLKNDKLNKEFVDDLLNNDKELQQDDRELQEHKSNLIITIDVFDPESDWHERSTNGLWEIAEQDLYAMQKHYKQFLTQQENDKVCLETIDKEMTREEAKRYSDELL